MKKTLSVLAVLGIVSIIGTQSANAFSWSNLNPWSKCKSNRCEKKIEQQCPCPTGYAAPCDPCAKKVNPCDKKISKPCDACDRLQQDMMSE